MAFYIPFLLTTKVTDKGLWKRVHYYCHHHHHHHHLTYQTTEEESKFIHTNSLYIRIRYIHVYIVCIFLYTSGKYMPVCGTFIYTMIGKMFMVNEKLGRMNSSSLQLCIYRHHTHCWIVLLNSFLHFTPTQRTSQFQWYRNVTYSSLPPLPCLQVWNNLLLNSQLESIEIGSPF